MTTRPRLKDAVPVALPLVLIAIILTADALEGPKTAYVGLLATTPMLAAVFGTTFQTAIVGFSALASAFVFGLVADDGNVPAQTVRLIAISIFSVIAVLAARQRVRRELDLIAAQKEAALAETMAHRARTDELTGVLNRRGAEHVLAARPVGVPWTIAIADCDGFKFVNDQYGHAIGDEFLRAIAQRMRASLPEKDILARWGGDEFLLAVALPPESAVRVFERVHRQVTESPIRTAAGSLHAKLTLGYASWSELEDVGDAIRRADRAMYRGKGAGANQILADS